MRFRHFLGLPLLVVVLGFGGCTGQLPKTAPAFVAAASNAAQAEGSLHLEADFDFTGGGDNGSGFTAQGWFDYLGHRSRMVYAFDGSEVEARVVADTTYVRIDGIDEWARATADDIPLDTLPLGVDPVVRIGWLAPAATELKELAGEKLGETRVSHHHVTFDPAKIPEDSGEQLLTEASALSMDFWLDSRGRPLKIEVQGTFKAGESSFIDAGDPDGVMTVSIAIDGYGEPVDIQEPPADSVSAGLDDDPFGTTGVTEHDILKQTDPPCFGAKVEACKAASAELRAAYNDQHACDGTAKRMCLLPLGNPPKEQIEALRAYFKDQYGLTVAVLPPMDATDAIGGQVNPDQWKVDAHRWETEFLRLYGNLIEASGRIIAITPVDLHSDADDVDSFVFGTKWNDTNTKEGLYGIVSTFRMNPQTFGEPLDDALWFERIRKLVTKYVGIQYYGLVEDDDSPSAMYRALYSIRALDGIKGHLPVAYGAPPAAMAPRPTSPAPLSDAPCGGKLAFACLRADPALALTPFTPGGCDVPGAILCIVPAGSVPLNQIAELVAQLGSIEGLRVAVALAIDVPASKLSSPRGAIDAGDLINLVGGPDSVYADLDPRKEVSFLVITPLDLPAEGGSDFAFFARSKDDKTLAYRYAAFSTFRINPETYGRRDDQVLRQRITILATRAAGTVFFHLADSADETSPMSALIPNLSKLDAMTAPLK